MGFPTAEEGRKFDHVLGAWREAADALRVSREAYRSAYAQATLACAPEAKEAARKAFADAQTSTLRAKRDSDEVIERECYHAMIFYRGSAGETAERNAA